jgi:hypothetical protein
MLWAAVRGAWVAWKRLARRIGEVQSRLLLAGLYGLLVLPTGLLLRLLADPLARRPPAESNWRARRDPTPGLGEARRQ